MKKEKIITRFSAVDWLASELPIDWSDPHYREVLSKAKAMEKEHMQDAYWEGGQWDPPRGGFDAYYNGTFDIERD